MRVGVDATSWHNTRGFGRFARNAVGRLIELDPESTYVLFMDGRTARDRLPARAEVRPVTLAAGASGGAGRPLRDFVGLARAVRRSRVDVFLFPSLYTFFAVPGVPAVVGLHDTTAEQYPELTLPGRRGRLLWRAKQWLALRTAARLFTVSEASKAALVERFGLDPQRLVVVPEAPEPAFAPPPEEQRAAALRAVRLSPDDRPFVYGAGISPHKNVVTLVRAYARLREERPGAPPLVLVGALADEPFLSAEGDVRSEVARLGLGESVVLPGFVSDETLAGLYGAATAAVVPSLAEGFGLPAVEAAACGAALILSDLPAHHESLGDDALYFPPQDVEALAALLERVLAEPGLADELGHRAQRRVAGLTWDAAAPPLRKLLEEACAGGGSRA